VAKATSHGTVNARDKIIPSIGIQWRYNSNGATDETGVLLLPPRRSVAGVERNAWHQQTKFI
jgi:hypothetical protein